jgi:hypothetical protein
LEFVGNREPKGAFGAVVEALTRRDQGDINAALAAVGLYDPFEGVSIASDLDYDAAMIKARIPVRFEELLPHFDPKSSNKSFAEEPVDDSPDAIEQRLRRIKEASSWDDHQGLLIAYPRQLEGQTPSLHFIAAVEPQATGAALTVMDPSDPRQGGGVFYKTEEEVREILTPEPELGIPVCGYLVKLDLLPTPERHLPAAEALAGADRESVIEGMEAQLKEVPVLV